MKNYIVLLLVCLMSVCAKYHRILCCIFFIMGQFIVAQNSGRSRIDLHQSDARFTIWAESHYNFVNDEYFYFYIQNNTNEKYDLVVNVTINSTCHPSRTFKLHVNKVVTLLPGGRFTPDSDWEHIFQGGSNAKDCRVKRGDSYTFLSSISYNYQSIVNVTEQETRKVEEERKRKEELERVRLEREAALQKKREEQEKLRLEQEAIALKKREDEQKRAQLEKAQNEKNAANRQIENKQQNSVAGAGVASSVTTKTTAVSAAEKRQIEFENQRQLQIKKNEEYQLSQKLAQEEAQRKRQEEHERVQAQIAENNRRSNALIAASAETASQWSQGNYLAGSTALVTEYASQGNSKAAYGTLAVGAGLEILSMISENQKRKEEEERQRAERARIAAAERERLRKIEEEKRQILEQQKREFNVLAEQSRSSKKDVIKKRDAYLNAETNFTQTFNIFAEENKPIYIFFVQTNTDYNHYQENISFPNTIEIDIKENADLYISPIIAIYPTSNGEYPFLKDIFAEIATNFVNHEKGKHRIFNWTEDLEAIQKQYNEEIDNGRNANFNLVFPEKTIVDFREREEIAEGEKNYWGGESLKNPKPENSDSKENQTQTETQTQTPAQTNEIDYWGTPK